MKRDAAATIQWFLAADFAVYGVELEYNRALEAAQSAWVGFRETGSRPEINQLNVLNKEFAYDLILLIGVPCKEFRVRVKTINLGDSLLFSGEDASEVDAVLKEHLRRGSTTITRLSDIGGSWIASCTVPTMPVAPDHSPPKTLESAAPAPSRRSEGVKIIDAGESIMIRGDSEEEVRIVLERFLRRGSEEIGQIARVGRTEVWIASCSRPIIEQSADQTQTLRLADIESATDPDSLRESKGQCAIEKIGFKRVITGPSREHVELVVKELRQLGGELISEIAEEDGKWVAICDTARITNTGFRW